MIEILKNMQRISLQNRSFQIFRNTMEQSVQNINDNDLSSSSILYTSSYPPNEFPTSSIIDDDLTPSSVTTTIYDKEQQLATISTDEEDDNHLVEQSSSPTHTISSSNGHDTVRFLLKIKSKTIFFD
jgi:hypothetical protein